MAVDQDLLDRIASTIADLYRGVEAALVRTVAQQLRKDLAGDEQPRALGFYQEKLDAVRSLQASARVILASLQATRAQVIRDAIANAYRSGGDAAVADLPADWFPKSQIGQQARQAVKTIPNARVIENIAQALHRDVGRVDQNILRAPLDAYRAVQAGAAARITSGAFTRREASQAAWQRLTDKGLTNFVDRRGRVWKLSSYGEMLARTNAQRAAVQGQVDRLAALDIDLMSVSDNVQECVRCRPFEGKVLAREAGMPTGSIQVEHATHDDVMVTVHVVDTLPGAMAKGFLHPNCRHSVSIYLPGVTKLKTGTADPKGDKARQRQRALERRIRAAKEGVLGALTEDAKTVARARVVRAQAALDAHMKAHPALKRLKYREQIGAGNLPSKNGPKGGAVEDLQPPVQQQLPIIVGDGRDDGGPVTVRPATPPRTPAPPPAASPVPAAEPKPAREQDLAERIALGERSREKLSGGMYGETSLVTLNDGSQVIHKKVTPTHLGDDAVDQTDAEILGGTVARALGLQAPRAHRVGPTELFLEFMPGKVAAAVRKKPAGWATSDDAYRLGFLDGLTDYADRHADNWIIDGDRLTSIDHGLTFRYTDMALDRITDGRPITHPAASPFEKLFMRKGPTSQLGVGEWVDNDMSPADMAAAREALTALRGEFEQLGRTAWWEAMMARLTAITPYAKGTKRRIP